jgi:hypothetical protein
VAPPGASDKETALSDWYTKLMLTVLTVLAACAVALAAQGLRGSGGGGGSEEEGRYRLQIVPMGRMILKFDSETGNAWRANFPDPKVWLPIADEPLDTLDDGTPEEEEEDQALDEPEEAASPGPSPADPMAGATP